MGESKGVNGKSLETVKFFNLPRQELVIDLPKGKLDRFQPLFEILHFAEALATAQLQGREYRKLKFRVKVCWKVFSEKNQIASEYTYSRFQAEKPSCSASFRNSLLSIRNTHSIVLCFLVAGLGVADFPAPSVR